MTEISCPLCFDEVDEPTLYVLNDAWNLIHCWSCDTLFQLREVRIVLVEDEE
jgi:hypothetical protein